MSSRSASFCVVNRAKCLMRWQARSLARPAGAGLVGLAGGLRIGGLRIGEAAAIGELARYARSLAALTRRALAQMGGCASGVAGAGQNAGGGWRGFVVAGRRGAAGSALVLAASRLRSALPPPCGSPAALSVANAPEKKSFYFSLCGGAIGRSDLALWPSGGLAICCASVAALVPGGMRSSVGFGKYAKRPDPAASMRDHCRGKPRQPSRFPNVGRRGA